MFAFASISARILVKSVPPAPYTIPGHPSADHLGKKVALPSDSVLALQQLCGVSNLMGSAAGPHLRSSPTGNTKGLGVTDAAV